MSELSPRLTAVADWVIKGRPVADIGSDHAGLVINLLTSGHCPQAIITDINPQPLQRAVSIVKTQGLYSQCDFRLGDGLTPLKPGEVDTVCIAGMGGHTIADILESSPEKLASFQRLLLQPMNVFVPLRIFLSRVGYPILQERAVQEGNKFFVILEIGTQMVRPYELTDLEAEVGPHILKHPHLYANKCYLAQWKHKYEQRLIRMSYSDRLEVELERQQLTGACATIEEVLAGC